MPRKKKIKISIHVGAVNFLAQSADLARLYTHKFIKKGWHIDGITPPKNKPFIYEKPLPHIFKSDGFKHLKNGFILKKIK